MITLNSEIKAKASSEGLGFATIPEGEYIFQIVKFMPKNDKNIHPQCGVFSTAKGSGKLVVRDEEGAKKWANGKPVRSEETTDFEYIESKVILKVISDIDGGTKYATAMVSADLTTHPDWFDGPTGYPSLLHASMGDGASLPLSKVEELQKRHVAGTVKHYHTNPDGKKMKDNELGIPEPVENRCYVQVKSYRFNEDAIKLNKEEVPGV